MKDFETIKKLDDLILDLEISQEKANVISDDIDQGYFDLNDDGYKLYRFCHASTEFGILRDYIIQIGGTLKKIRGMLLEWRGEKGDADPVFTTNERSLEGVPMQEIRQL